MKCWVGPKSVILEGAKLSDECMIGPNSVVPPGRLIPTGQLWAGNPVRFIRNLTAAEKWNIKATADWM
jgi:carbonic anhydrase/acetyltransferase-like protein (isoleucine patch superfamily)